jgi:hypothetical protein
MNLIVTIVMTLVLAGSAFAVDMHCTKTDKWTTVCKFSDGSVNVVSDFRDSDGRGDYDDDWYTAEEWAAQEAFKNKPQQQKQDEATTTLCARGDFTKAQCDAYFTKRKMNPASDAEAGSYKTQPGCEDAGLVWSLGVCHRNGWNGVYHTRPVAQDARAPAPVASPTAPAAPTPAIPNKSVSADPIAQKMLDHNKDWAGENKRLIEKGQACTTGECQEAVAAEAMDSLNKNAQKAVDDIQSGIDDYCAEADSDCD